MFPLVRVRVKSLSREDGAALSNCEQKISWGSSVSAQRAVAMFILFINDLELLCRHV